MAGSDIFISYSREDRQHAHAFASGLEEEGFRVWWDNAIHSGDTFDEVIENELRLAKAVVVLWSPRSVTSRWVRAEATIADRHKKLVPAIIEPCDRPIIFELTHTAELSKWKGDRSDQEWKVFVSDLWRQVGDRPASKAPAQSEAPPPEPKSAPTPITAVPASPDTEADDFEEYEATQFYVAQDKIDFLSEEVHCLEVVNGDEMELRFVIDGEGKKLGRARPADIILHDQMISRTHCQLRIADGELFVTDLSSTNGTFVDGERIEGETKIPPESTIRIGGYELVHSIRTRAEV